MSDPIARFAEWFADYKAHSTIPEPSAVTLATATANGIPSARVVLLKSFDARGFVFYTHMDSRKSEELKANPHAALCFNWIARGRQVRIEGKVERVSDAEADTYFATRPLGARIGALISHQSRPLASQETFMHEIAACSARYSESSPPSRPANWSGWRIVPHAIEFWQEGRFRLHDRDLYTRLGQEWTVQKLYP